jgi:hypothetical protein
VREEAHLLDDVADGTAELDGIDSRDVAAVDEDPTGGRLDKAVDHAHGGGLAAAGGPDEDRQLAAHDVEGQLLHRHGAVRERLAHLLEPDHRLGAGEPRIGDHAVSVGPTRPRGVTVFAWP